MLNLIKLRQQNHGRPIALYVERELVRDHSLYQSPAAFPRRAVGPPQLPEVGTGKFEIGSEGIIGNIVTRLTRQNSNDFLAHPTMESLRDAKPSCLIIVTDFIGSGKRIYDFLTSMQRTPSLVSWVSYHRITIEVVAYTGTIQGLEFVRGHALQPLVTIHTGCPTIHQFTDPERTQYIELCRAYAPGKPRTPITPLGYGDVGALIAFSHSAPNNMPLIFHRTSSTWKPLFAGRSTVDAWSLLSQFGSANIFPMWLRRIGQNVLSRSLRLLKTDQNTQQMILVLSASKRKPRTFESISSNTGIPVEIVRERIQRAQNAGLLDPRGHLTDAGYRELRYMRKPINKSRKSKHGLFDRPDSPYFPKQLRPPRD